MDARGLLALLLAVGACGSSRPPQMRHPDGCSVTTPRPGHSLEVYLSVESDGATRALCPGEALHHGDALQVRVDLDRRAHLQLLFVDPRGNAGAVSPQTDARTDRAVFHAPAGLLTQHPGEAQLLLVASEDPLEQVDPALYSLFEAIRDTGVVVDREGHIHLPARAAPGKAMRFDTQAALHADFDEHGVAVLGLSLRAD